VNNEYARRKAYFDNIAVTLVLTIRPHTPHVHFLPKSIRMQAAFSKFSDKLLIDKRRPLYSTHPLSSTTPSRPLVPALATVFRV